MALASASTKEAPMIAAKFDVAVVGTGPVGLAAALGFAQAGFSVGLVGPAPSGRDGRTAALMQGSIELLERLGLWPALAADAAPLRVMRIVDDTESLFRPPPVSFRAAEIELDAFGWNIENATLAAALAERVRATSMIGWYESLATGFAAGDPARVLLADGSVEAALVVAADGRGSRIREAAGLRAHRMPYPQRALTTILRHTRDHEDASTEFHTRSGPFTLVPLPGRRSSLVWVTNPHHAERLLALPDAELVAAIERRAHGLLGSIEIDGPRGSVPLGRLSVDTLVGERLALAGEAAHALPPIGAQGLNLGFADVDTLLGLVRSGEDPGAEMVLRRYARARAGDVGVRSAAVDALNRALLADMLPVDALRGLGLGLLAHVGPLRRFVMRSGLTRPALSARTVTGARSRSSAAR
jgi:2-octaprenyl-6-methoxyphenol hydroxylase